MSKLLCTTVVGVLALVSATARDLRSELVTFRFHGQVTNVLVDVPDYVGVPSVDWPEVGTSFNGFYTFDSTAHDTAASVEQGAYKTVLENGVAVDVSVGDLRLTSPSSVVATYASIYEAGDWIPGLDLVSHPADATIFNRNHFQLSIRKNGLLPGTILPLTPPDILSADSATLSLLLDNGLNTRPAPYVSIAATVDLLSLIPLTGDYNGDGMVDAADYAAWRETDGSQHGYDVWRANFGKTVEVALPANDSPSVPEPATLLLLLTACGCFRRCCP